MSLAKESGVDETEEGENERASECFVARHTRYVRGVRYLTGRWGVVAMSRAAIWARRDDVSVPPSL